MHYRLLARTVVLEVGVACLLAVVGALVGPGRSRRGRERPFPVTWAVFRESTSRVVVANVILRAADGTTYQGDVSNFESTGPLADRQIALARPITVTRGKTGKQIHVDHPWDRLVLTLDKIDEMYVSFKDPPPRLRASRRVSRWMERQRGLDVS
jgi:hypothetical protein